MFLKLRAAQKLVSRARRVQVAKRAHGVLKQAHSDKLVAAAIQLARENHAAHVAMSEASAVGSNCAIKAAAAAEDAARRALRSVHDYCAIKLQTIARARQGKTMFEVKVWATLKMQGLMRRMEALWKYKSIQMARRPWSRFLLPNERVILSSVVRKSGGNVLARTKRRQLLLTSYPRIMYVKVTEMELRGVIDLSDVETCALGTEEGHFEIIVPGRTYDICVLSGDAKQ